MTLFIIFRTFVLFVSVLLRHAFLLTCLHPSPCCGLMTSKTSHGELPKPKGFMMELIY